MYTLPAGFTVQAKFIPDPALHLHCVELLLVQLAVAGVNLAAARADGYLGSCFEPATVLRFKVTRQIAFPMWHIIKDIACILPAQGEATLGALHCILF